MIPQITPEQALFTRDRYRRDPAAFVREVLGDEPWEKQIEILEAMRDNHEVAVKSCHGIGKDWTAARVVLWFLYTHKPSIVITTGPTSRQVRGILWKEISVAHSGAQYDLGGRCLTQELRLAPNWWAWGFTAPEYDPNRFQGWHEQNVLVVIDEACGISQDIYTAIDGIMSNENAYKLEIGNPTDIATPFGKSFSTPGIHKISINAFESPNFTTFGITEKDIANDTWEKKIKGRPLPAPWLVTPAWVSKRYHRWGPDNPLYLARVKAQFPDEGVDSLIPLSWIEAAQNRELTPSEPHELGVDVARYGDDQTVIVERQGPVVRLYKQIGKQSTMQTAGHVVRALKDTGAELAKVDVVGVGAGVADRLMELAKPVAEASAGERSKDPEQNKNARADWFWGLRERFEQGDIDIDPDPEGEELKAQLSAIKWKVNSRGQVEIEPKEEMKKRGLPSPDWADAVAIVFADLQRFSFTFGIEDVPDETEIKKRERTKRKREREFQKAIQKGHAAELEKSSKRKRPPKRTPVVEEGPETKSLDKPQESGQSGANLIDVPQGDEVMEDEDLLAQAAWHLPKMRRW